MIFFQLKLGVWKRSMLYVCIYVSMYIIYHDMYLLTYYVMSVGYILIANVIYVKIIIGAHGKVKENNYARQISAYLAKLRRETH